MTFFKTKPGPSLGWIAIGLGVAWAVSFTVLIIGVQI